MSETKGNFDKDPALDFSSNNYNSNYNDQFGAPPPPYHGANPNPGFNPGSNPGVNPGVNPGGFQQPIQSPPAPVVMSYDHMNNRAHAPKVKLGPRPVQMLCPNCNSNISTKTDTKAGQKSWIFCLGLCFIGYLLHTYII